MSKKGFNDLKEYIITDGIGFAFLAILNIVVFNFRIEESTMILRILLSFFTIIAYIIALMVIFSFVNGEFQIIYKMTKDKKENYFESNWMYARDLGTKESIIDRLKTKFIQYGTIGFLIIDLVSIFFYRSSVILEILAFLVKYVLGQAEKAG